MSDIIYYKNGEKTFRISPPTVGTKCPETKLEVKKMTEIEKTEGEIKVLQAKLELLKEMEKHKSPCEGAYKRVYGHYPDEDLDDYGTYYDTTWINFLKGYESAQKDYKVGAYQPKGKEQKWGGDIVRESVKWCEEHPDESVEDYLTPQTPEQVDAGLRNAMGQAKKDGVFDAVDEPLEYDEVEWDISETAPEVTTENALLEAYKATFGKYPTVGSSASKFDIQSWNIFQYGFRLGCGELQSSVDDDSEETASQEPTPNKSLQRILDGKINERGYVDMREPTTVFRQKLFDGIKSVFYDPIGEKTHWKMKVNMAVDEVLTHFYDILPEPQQEPIYGDFDKAWNSCLKSIKIQME